MMTNTSMVAKNQKLKRHLKKLENLLDGINNGEVDDVLLDEQKIPTLKSLVRAYRSLNEHYDQLEYLVKERTASLRISEERFRLAAAVSDEAIWDCDLVTGVTWRNERYTRVFGSPGENEDPRQWWIERIHPDDRNRVLTAFDATIHGTAEKWQDEYRFQRADDNWADIVDRAHISRDINGRAVRILGTMHDLTRQKNAERLKDSLIRISEMAHGKIKFSRIITDILPEAAQACGCESAFVSLRKGGEWFVDYVHGLPEEMIGAVMNDNKERHAVLAGKSGKPVAVNDAFTDKKVDIPYMKKIDVRSVLVVPFFEEKVVEGVIFLNYHSRKQVFNTEHLDFAAQLSSIIGLALKNARLFEKANIEIRERKKSEAKMESQHELLQSIIDGIPVMLVLWDPDFRGFMLNRCAEKIIGCQKSDEDEREFMNRNHTEKGCCRETISPLQKLSPGWHELVLEAMDGSRILSRWANIRISDGSIISIGIDLRELQRVEEALAASRQQLQNVIDNTSHLVYILDLEERFLIANNAVADLFGVTVEDLIGKKREGFMPREIAAAHEANDRKVIETGKSMEFEEQGSFKGRDITFLTVKFPLYDMGGDLYAIAGISSDISARKSKEVILKRDKQSFEKLVRKRTRQLLKARLDLEKSKRLSDIGLLAATVAHELRNPLAAIGLAAYNIKRKAQLPDIEKHLTRIRNKVEESDHIIDNLLSYSRIKPPCYEKVKIGRIIEECIAMIRKRGKNRPRVVAKLETLKDSIIEADPVQIGEVFNNILNNACDAVSGDSGMIEITAKNGEKFVSVFIRDNGPGIAKDIVDMIFDPFFTTKAKGTGLGLSVCWQIVGMHGGKIGLAQKNGEGTAIYVKLPKNREETEE